ncbi:hypothetical protein PR202_gn00548 [Eleusine coracana subsp. coracana]|uniref:AP2/ERF domain-containing protein n=1 Tax=Eleusine coracana subsp. coracana TaxID=191504 RepID=A0AAV5G3V1_ELECO|nr:hypothetical protein PR202_gn00548 [Eleusine coracana subsp. coracana]
MGSTNNWLGFSGAGVSAQLAQANAEPPKLENFLGVHERMAAPATGRPFGAGGGSSTTIGLSMIKNWLRRQPAPAAADDGMALVALPEVDGKVVASGDGKVVEAAAAQQKKAAAETFGQRTSVYRGVTKHRWTGRYEAHLWDNSCRREGQTRKGRQGGYDKEEKAARAYDLTALKYWGTTTTTNFPVSEYEKELEEMKHMTRQEYVASLRRQKNVYCDTEKAVDSLEEHQFTVELPGTQEEAAEAYDIAAIKFRGLSAVTNFDMSRYDIKSIIESQIPVGGGTTKCIKNVPEHFDDAGHLAASNLLTEGIGSYAPRYDTYGGWGPITFLSPLQNSIDHCHSNSTMWCKQEEQDGAVVAAAHSLHNLNHLRNLGSSTHNFYQPLAVQEVMGFSDIHPQSLDSNLVMHSNHIGYHHGAVSRSGYSMPVACKLVEGQGNHAASSYGDDDRSGTVSDHYNGRNLYYYHSQDSPVDDASKNNTFGQGVEYENWVSSPSVMAQKATDMMVCHGLPLYHENDS